MKEEDNLNSILRLFAKSSIILFIGILISKIFTYLYKIIIAREFGQEIYGVFSLAAMIVGVFVSLFSLGFQNGLLRYISFYRGKGEFKKIKSLVFFSAGITLLTSIFSAFLLFFFSEQISVFIFHSPDLILFLKWFAIFLPVFIFVEFLRAVILAYEKVGWYSFLTNILPQITQFLLLGAFILLGLGAEGIPLSYSFGLLVVFLSSLFVSNYLLKGFFNRRDKELREGFNGHKEFLYYSLPMMFLGLVASIFSWVDTFTIGYFKTPVEVGIYNAAIPLSYLLLIIPVLFLQLFLPIITKEYSRKNMGVIRKLSKQLGKWIFIFNFPILLLIFLFPGAIINLLFGPEYLGAETALRFLSVGAFVFSFSQISENLLSMLGKSKRILFNLIIATIINIILNIILIPIYGIDGAAFATMIGYIIWGALSLGTAKYYTSIFPFKKEIIKIFLISIIPTIALIYVKKYILLSVINILLLVIGFFIVYLLLVFLTHSLDKEDLMIVSTIKGKFKKD